ncbi:MAG: hypothetical protein ACRC7N_09560, partial [Clostridium sp.]
MFCHYCGSNIDEGVDYCLSCGKPVVKDLGDNNQTNTTKDNFNSEKQTFKDVIKMDIDVNSQFYNNASNSTNEIYKESKGSKKTIITGIILVSIIAAVVGGFLYFKNGGSSPEMAVRNFFENIAKGNAKKAMEYTNLDQMLAGNETLKDVFITQFEKEMNYGETSEIFKIVDGLLDSAEYEV